MLGGTPLIAFVSTADPGASRAFYQERLGLELVEDAPSALVFATPNAMLRVAKVDEAIPSQETVLGWEVDDVAATVEALSDRGVELLRYDGVDQDDRGVATFPSGARVAWFEDPDGNVLSVTEFAGGA